MPDISTRINALIAYLFLGPLLLLVKPGTPLAHPFVRGHAKRASIIILVGFLAFIGYYLIRHMLSFALFGISISAIVVGLIVSVTLFFLIVGAYRSYSGVPADEISWKSFSLPNNITEQGEYDEVHKIRIIASFVPFLGIIMGAKYPTIQEVLIGRKISNLFSFIFLANIVFFSGTTTTLALILTILYIVFFVVMAVQLFIFSRFLEFGIYSVIPTYLQFEAHVQAIIRFSFHFLRIAFGGTDQMQYSERYAAILEKNSTIQVASEPYFTGNWIFAIPVLNLITIPSLWQQRYREYAGLILQGFLVTILLIWMLWMYNSGSQIVLFLLFPILTLVMSGSNVHTRAPITSIMVGLSESMKRGKEKIAAIQEKEEKVEFKYEVTDSPQ